MTARLIMETLTAIKADDRMSQELKIKECNDIWISLLRYDYGKGLCYKGGKSSNSKQSIKQVDEELYKKHSLLYAFGQKLNNQPHILKIIKDLLPTQDLLKDGEQVGDNISPDYIVLFQDLIKIKTNSTIYR